MKKITINEIMRSEDYAKSEPKQFGNLHERMKFLLKTLKNHNHGNIPHDVCTAADDLETEVKFHEPVSPPYARRIIHKGG